MRTHYRDAQAVGDAPGFFRWYKRTQMQETRGAACGFRPRFEDVMTMMRGLTIRASRFFYCLVGGVVATVLVFGPCRLVAATPGGSKSIFDDDWTPPAVRKPELPAVPTKALPTTAPATTLPATAPWKDQPGSPPAPPPFIGTISARRSMPAKAEQARARRLFKEVFAAELADHSTTARRALAAKLLEQVGKSADAPVDQFVLAMGAADAAREGGDLSMSFRAIDDAAAVFEFDSLAMNSDTAIGMAGRVTPPGTNVENGRAALRIAQELIDQDSYLTAARVIAALKPAVTGDAAMLQQFQTAEKKADMLRTGAALIAKDFEHLKVSPDDAVANLAVGRFICFTKRDWSRGLPMLAKGSQPALKLAATTDMALPTDEKLCAELGDIWWDVAVKETSSVAKRAERQRAAFWYDGAVGRLTALRKVQVEQRLEEVHKAELLESTVSGGSGSVTASKQFAVVADIGWVPVEFSVVEGKCYRIVAHGEWTDSRGTACGPEGICPRQWLSVLGPQSMLTEKQRADWYVGQHPRSALVARFGDDKTGFFVGSEKTFVAPTSGKVAFRMNDAAGPAPGRHGKMEVSVTETEPQWLDNRGTVAIYARIDDVDLLHITPTGVFWEWGGHWGKVGEYDGHYPTIINGVLWWPKWTDPMRTEVLSVPGLQLNGRVQLVRVDAKRGNVELKTYAGNEVVLRFTDEGLGSSQVGCVVRFTK